ncbi:PEX12 protein, partial [Polypterus senegalus]
MAQRAAHLTTVVADLDDRPSIFEVIAQESLMETVRPALEHAIKVLVDANPARYCFLWKWFDEIYTVLNLLLQHHFLSQASASFAENFYGMKRMSLRRPLVSQPPASQGLPKKQHLYSLLLLVLFPYIRTKLEKFASRLREEDDYAIHLSASPKKKFYKAFLAAYPFVSMTWEGWIFSQQLLYVFGRTKHHSPLLKLAGVRLAYLTADDIRALESVPPSPGSGLHQRGDIQVALKIAKGMDSYRKAARSEARILAHINLCDSEDRQSCVRMLNWFHFHGHVCIVFELLGLSTYDFLQENNFYPYPLEQIRHMGWQIFRAKRYEKKIKNPDVKIADFGNAVYHDEDHSSEIQTRHYRAPEVILDDGLEEPVVYEGYICKRCQLIQHLELRVAELEEELADLRCNRELADLAQVSFRDSVHP